MIPLFCFLDKIFHLCLNSTEGLAADELLFVKIVLKERLFEQHPKLFDCLKAMKASPT